MKKKNSDDLSKGGLLREAAETKPFNKTNFILIAVCLCLIILGFALMAGPGSSIDSGFNPDIFSARRIIVGPLFAFLGFLLMAFAIIYRRGMFGRKKDSAAKPEQTPQATATPNSDPEQTIVD